MQVDLQGSREDADRCEEEAENHLQVLEAKVSELEAKLGKSGAATFAGNAGVENPAGEGGREGLRE